MFQLSAKKSELKNIYNGIYELSGFSADCDKSIIHRLIFTLLQTIQGADIDKSHMAAQCLAELGPSDLGTMVLRPDTHLQIYKWVNDYVCYALLVMLLTKIFISQSPSYDEVIDDLFFVALERLNSLLMHTDVRVTQAVVVASRYLMGSLVPNTPNKFSRTICARFLRYMTY